MTDALKVALLFLGFLAAGTVLALAWAGLVVLVYVVTLLLEIGVTAHYG
jgi:hypothetical protein